MKHSIMLLRTNTSLCLLQLLILNVLSEWIIFLLHTQRFQLQISALEIFHQFSYTFQANAEKVSQNGLQLSSHISLFIMNH